jgi:hypothetical protein
VVVGLLYTRHVHDTLDWSRPCSTQCALNRAVPTLGLSLTELLDSSSTATVVRSRWQRSIHLGCWQLSVLCDSCLEDVARTQGPSPALKRRHA